MPRYIDADILKKHGWVLAKIKTDKKGVVTKIMSMQIEDAPTADVVPKSEVAMDIFEDLDNLAQFIQVPSEFKDGCLMITNSPYLCIKPSDYAELKKKYTEENV